MARVSNAVLEIYAVHVLHSRRPEPRVRLVAWGIREGKFGSQWEHLVPMEEPDWDDPVDVARCVGSALIDLAGGVG